MSTTPSAKGVQLSFLPGFIEITSPGGKAILYSLKMISEVHCVDDFVDCIRFTTNCYVAFDPRVPNFTKAMFLARYWENLR